MIVVIGCGGGGVVVVDHDDSHTSSPPGRSTIARGHKPGTNVVLRGKRMNYKSNTNTDM